MLKGFFEKRRKREQEKVQRELEFVQYQISAVLKENDELRSIATKCVRESAGHQNETRDERMRGRSDDLRHNSILLDDFNTQKIRLERKLGKK